LEKPVEPLGRDTRASIQAGLYHGYRGLVKEIVFQLKKKLGRSTQVLATGGQAKWILKDLGVVDKHEPYLTLFGLKLIWLDRSKGAR
jgi:type III pantothenate kinase